MHTRCIGKGNYSYPPLGLHSVWGRVIIDHALQTIKEKYYGGTAQE